MPGLSCALPQCNVYQQKGGPSLFKITKLDDEWSRNWREKVVNVISKVRVLDARFKKQIDEKSFAVCEHHYKENCIIRRKSVYKLYSLYLALELVS